MLIRTLTVTSVNQSARSLYQRLGFQSFGVEQRAVKLGDAYFDKEHMVMFLD